jgi:hypothetical protein
VVDVPWGQLAYNTFVPSFAWQKDYIVAIVAVLGTIITPVLPSLTAGTAVQKKSCPAIDEYKRSWYNSPLQVDACEPTYNPKSLTLSWPRSTAGSIGPSGSCQPPLGTDCRQHR